MAGMTKVNVEGPYASGLLNSVSLEVDTATGTNTDSTEIRAATASEQIYIVGGHVAMEAAGVLKIFSATTLIGQIELPAAGTYPLPPVYTTAGEALKMQNVDGVTIHIWCESQSLKRGAYSPLVA